MCVYMWACVYVKVTNVHMCADFHGKHDLIAPICVILPRASTHVSGFSDCGSRNSDRHHVVFEIRGQVFHAISSGGKLLQS